MRLREERIMQGYTGREFAKMLDITPNYLSSIENGKKPLSPKVRRKAGLILGIDPKMLCE